MHVHKTGFYKWRTVVSTLQEVQDVQNSLKPVVSQEKEQLLNTTVETRIAEPFTPMIE